jgi:dipeptidyl aminopeptidase/acylaminoacyl peptidase
MRTHTTIARPLAILGLTALAAAACSDATMPVAPVVPTAPSLAKSTPPVNGRIYFTSNFTTNYDVYSMKPDGSDRRRLTLTSDAEAYVDVSPDGKKLVVGSMQANSSVGELLTMNVDGTNRRVIVTDPNSFIGYPEFSPDGRTVAYVTRVSGNPQTHAIWTVSVNGGKATRLTQSTESAVYPSWSPDGSRIVYTSETPGTSGGDLYIMNADGSARQLLHDCAIGCGNPVWSPDGGRIVYMAAVAGSTQFQYCDLLKAVPQCGIPIGNAANPTTVALSPDGSQLVYATLVEENGSLVHRVMTSNVSGSGETALTADLSFIYDVAWGR